MSDTDGTITWFEIATEDADRARSFYGGLFGWQFQPFDPEHPDYQVTNGGAVYASDERGITVYFGTSDIDASVALVRELGGSSDEPQPIPNVGRYAQCADTEGTAFGLFEAGSES
jgi:predicted enzyme related to lactoylglutathione lyase